MVALLASSVAGAAAAFITTPFDVVKTRRQVQARTEVLSELTLVKKSQREKLIKLNDMK